MVLMLIAYLMLSSCRKKVSRQTHLHNYPVFKDYECPSQTSKNHYDEHDVKIKAAALKIRPVDYLHRMNNKRYQPIRKPGEVTKVGDYKLKE